MKKAIISLIFLLSFSAGASAATNPELSPTAPERYVVQSGDTLWGIATRFLKDAWRWPELWKMNQSQLRNPHRIYPGDVLVLERSGGQATLRLETTQLSPRVRIEARGSDAIQTISPSAIEPFLSRPLIVSEKELDSAPEIMATEEDRVALGSGAIAYVRGLQDQKATRWQLFRRGELLVDPDTQQPLGYVAIYLGEAELRRAGPISTIHLTSAVREVSRGDKLLPLDAEKPVFSYVPHAPAAPVRGRIISTYGGGGLREAGPLTIVTLSKGARDGLEVGHVLAISRELRSARYAERTAPLWGRTGPTGNDDPIAYVPAEITSRDAPMLATAPAVHASDFAQLPSERYGLLMVFRTFERASYALVMKAARPVAMSDIVSNP
jgi:LysM domain